jgi:SCY1-like protein 2
MPNPIAPPSRPGTQRIAPPPSFNAAALSTLQPRQPTSSSSSLTQPLQPQGTGSFSHSSPSPPSLQQQLQKPNYNIALPTVTTTPMIPPMAPMIPAFPVQPSGGSFSKPPFGSISSAPLFASPPAMGNLLTPSKPAQQSWNANKKTTNNDWGDFDPLG